MRPAVTGSDDLVDLPQRVTREGERAIDDAREVGHARRRTA